MKRKRKKNTMAGGACATMTFQYHVSLPGPKVILPLCRLLVCVIQPTKDERQGKGEREPKYWEAEEVLLTNQSGWQWGVAAQDKKWLPTRCQQLFSWWHQYVARLCPGWAPSWTTRLDGSHHKVQQVGCSVWQAGMETNLTWDEIQAGRWMLWY